MEMAGTLTLFQGPVGAGKSQEIKRMIDDGLLDLAVEYTRLWAAMRLIERGADGFYPIRADADPFNRAGFGNTLKKVAVTEALGAGLRTAVSTSKRGEEVLWQGIADAANADDFNVITIDPGKHTIYTRLVNADGTIAAECEKAIDRWY